MNAELDALKISAEQIENLSGVDVGEVFVGSVFGGTYRPSVFRHPRRLLLLGITEILMFALMFTLMLPIALFLFGDTSAGIRDLAVILRFLKIALALTILCAMAWNLYMRALMRRFKLLMLLLDDIDRYNEVIHTLQILIQIEAAQTQFSDRSNLLEAIRVTRNNLVTGLRTEKILRENRGVLTNRSGLINLEQNLTALQSLEVTDQATEYGRILSETLSISAHVHREVQKFSRSRRP